MRDRQRIVVNIFNKTQLDAIKNKYINMYTYVFRYMHTYRALQTEKMTV